MGILIAENNRLRDAGDIQLTEEILKLKNKGDHWGVIDLLVQGWMKKTPEEVEAFRIQVEDTRETLFDRKFAQTKGGKQQERRLTLIFPQKLLMMIRAMYKPDELQMDKEFYGEFLKRYPSFKIAEN